MDKELKRIYNSWYKVKRPYDHYKILAAGLYNLVNEGAVFSFETHLTPRYELKLNTWHIYREVPGSSKDELFLVGRLGTGTYKVILDEDETTINNYFIDIVFPNLI